MKKFFGSKTLIKYTFLLAIPSMLQQIITSLAQLVDNVMVGRLGSEQVAAVGIANQITFIFFFAAFGISSACGIFISQYMGTNNTRKVQETIRINLLLALSIGLVVFILVNLFPEWLVKLFVSNDEMTVMYAVGYLRRVSPIYLMFPLIVTYSFGFRYEGKPRYGLIMSLFAVITNTFLNYCLIYGNLGFHAYGVNGAAYATVISRIVELGIALCLSKYIKTSIYTKLTEIFLFERKLLKTVISKGWLIITNEIIWSASFTILNVIYSQKVSDNIASLQINSAMQNLAYVGSGGFATAIGVIVGNELGKDNLKLAKENARYLIRLCGLFACFVSIILLVSSTVFPNLYDVPKHVAKNASVIIVISAIFLSLRYIEMATFFVIRSGGDTTGILIVDSGFMCLFLLPLMSFIALFNLTLVERVFVGNLLMLPKTVLAYFIYRKETWIKNITV